VIVIDPGHGGKDPGITIAGGLEKTAVLELAEMVKQALLKNKESRFTVVLTREKDQTMGLDDRAAMANSAGARLFVSIHGAVGFELRIYIQDPDEGLSAHAAPASRDFLDFETGSEQQKMAWGSQQATHTKESGMLARQLAQHLGAGSAEPVQAPLAALKAVDAPAVVVEIGLGQDRPRAAEALAEGIAQYAREIR
jgi:N-acetylmuramoyl-L-alanine amidase